MYRQQGGAVPQGRQIVRLPEPGELGQIVVRRVTTFARRHKVISGSYILGILAIILIGSGTKLSYEQRRGYNEIMNTIDLLAILPYFIMLSMDLKVSSVFY